MLKDTREQPDAPEDTQHHAETQTAPELRREKPTWLTPAEAVKESGIGRTRLYGLLTSGEIPSAKLGRTRHIRRRDLDAFLEARMQSDGDLAVEK
jgi:excisionase family DNA binding protein